MKKLLSIFGAVLYLASAVLMPLPASADQVEYKLIEQYTRDGINYCVYKNAAEDVLTIKAISCPETIRR